MFVFLRDYSMPVLQQCRNGQECQKKPHGSKRVFIVAVVKAVGDHVQLHPGFHFSCQYGMSLIVACWALSPGLAVLHGWCRICIPWPSPAHHSPVSLCALCMCSMLGFCMLFGCASCWPQCPPALPPSSGLVSPASARQTSGFPTTG